MKTDKWFYQLFLTMPGIIAELIPNIPPDCEFDYIAPVIKEREFRLVGFGVNLPTTYHCLKALP